MKYYKEGIVEIDSRLTVKDFHWEVKFIGLDLETGNPIALINIWENYHVWPRQITFPTPPEYDQTNLIARCIEQLMKMPQFEGSTLVQ